MERTFIDYLQAEGFISPEQAAQCPTQLQDGTPLTPEEAGRKLVEAEVMSEKELADALFYYDMNKLVEENTITLSSDHIEDDFFAEYLNIVKKGFSDFLHAKASCEITAIYSSLQEELIIYQPLVGKEDNMFLTGVAGQEAYLMNMAATLHAKLAEDVDLPPFNPCKEDMLDFYFELLNNINSTCSYKFNINFDMDLPLCHENAVLNAPRIYTAEFMVYDFTITVFLVCGGPSMFQRVTDTEVE
jgi:hypothetical protein